MGQLRRALMGMLAITALVAGCLAAPSGADSITDTGDGVLGREEQLLPQELGTDPLDGLQHADPTDGLALIDPPEAGSQGDAALAYPIGVPPGRAGVQPDLALSYDSAGDNGWLGLGWDLGVGEVAIDTRWGAPRHDPARETETYLLDGDVLAPTAVRSEFLPREADRVFTRRVDGEFERIIRHGDSPASYWWEVTDKQGTTRYYGGTPEGERDPAAILADDDGNAYRWGLSGVQDISGNVMRLAYETAQGERVGEEAMTFGRQLYLRTIRYTGTIIDGLADDPPYEVRFLRDDDVADAAPRPDVLIDGIGGFAEVTSDLLRRVEVWYGAPAEGDPRTYDQLVGATHLHYAVGAFGKSLLTRIDQVGADGQVHGSHALTYHDEVRDADGDYQGFAPPEDWDAGEDGITETLLDAAIPSSALGSSLTVGADVHAYLGFNPVEGSKDGSFGGGLTVSGSVTEGLVELIDLNGDLLPDKVFRDVPGGPISYRLNLSGPDGGTTFGPAREIDLPALPSEFDVGFGGSIEGHFGVTVQFSVAGSLSFGGVYFADVNDDGLPDLVRGGQVLFNRLDGDHPSFSGGSGGTPVPVDDGTVDVPDLPIFDEIEREQRAQSPLVDTVRRWLAPYDGTIAITGDIVLDPPPGDGTSDGGAYDGDGVRVAVQSGPDEVWASTLTTPGQTATPAGVEALPVRRGQAVYFRVGAVDDGVGDRVRWSPTVTYTSLGEGTPTDVNGLDQRVFSAAADFTTAGRPDVTVGMPLAGTVRLEGTLVKSAATTDDLTILVTRGEEVVIAVPVAQDFIGEVPVNQAFEVTAPTADGLDQVEVRIAVDSPIDPTVLSFAPRLYYTEAVDDEGTPIPTTGQDGLPTLELAVPFDIDLYPVTDRVGPVEPSFRSGAGVIEAEVEADPGHRGGTVVLTVKTREGVVAEQVIAIPDTGEVTTTRGSVDGAYEDGVDHWVEVSVRSPDLWEAITRIDVGFGDAVDGPPVPHTANAAGRQGIFPNGHRGWGYAGYTAGGDRATAPLVEDDLVFDPDDYPGSCGGSSCEPEDFDDEGFDNALDGGAIPFIAAVVDVDGTPTPVWRGVKDTLIGGAEVAMASRRSVERIGVRPDQTGDGAGVRAPLRVGITGPTSSLTAGVGPISASLGIGTGIGIVDYVDLNGDGFPDVVYPGDAQLTGPRGGYVDSGDGLPSEGPIPVVTNDTSFAIGAGFSGSAVDITANALGDVGTAQDTAASSGTSSRQPGGGAAETGEQASGDEFGANVGGTISVGASTTNPVPADDTATAVTEAVPIDPPLPLEQELADVNGDGLPDRVTVRTSGVHVRLNLGGGFSEEIQWGGGSFENGESYDGSVGPTLGFNYNDREFSGGLSLNESIDFPRHSWVDVDGDGILDRLRKVADGSIRVAFGSGAGLQEELDYGRWSEGAFELVGEVPTGEQVAFSRSRGLGVGADFTVSIGPLCKFLCYLIVNPGAHAETSLSTDQVQLVDVDGDGYPDSVRSDADSELTVRRNTRGRTNLLAGVANPLGGEIRLGYDRAGNTVDQPYSQWVLSEVEVDDGRPGDGVDVQRTTYAYAGNRFDPLERELLGHAVVTEEERDADGAILRSTVRTYANATVFDAGQLIGEELRDADGDAIVRSTVEVVVLAVGPTLEASPSAALPAADPVQRLGQSGAPVTASVTHEWLGPDGATATGTRTEFVHDALGNVVEILELGEIEVPDDDTRAVISYPDCTDSSWVSVPEVITVYDVAGDPLRSRDGSLDLCVNSVPIQLIEQIGDDEVAVTDLTFDDHGNYNQITYPANADGERLTVDYVYDADRVTDIASVTDSHGLTATLTYDGPTGQVTSRTDPNGQTTSYTYDALGRVATVTGPYEQGTGRATITYEHQPTAPGYAYATARHFDAFDPEDPITTVAFVDGTGRLTQTKQDATVHRPDGLAEEVVVVAGAVSYDALGRPVQEWYPIEEALGSETAYNTGTSAVGPTTTTYAVTDRITSVTTPSGAVTAYAYGYAPVAPGGPVVFATTRTDAIGKQQVSFSDVRDLVLAVDDVPLGGLPLPTARTTFAYDGLGQLREVTDPGGAVTRHTYDLLGRRTSTDTPDGGLRVSTFDAAGNLVAFEDAVSRAAGQVVTYDYDHERLVAVRYQDGTPDVTYDYGGPGAPNNGAGRVIATTDGAREQVLTYDPLGAVARETSTVQVHNLTAGIEERVTFTTAFTYEAFGRLVAMTYPDGQVLAHDYDSGGRLSAVAGVKGSHAYAYVDRMEYDEFGDRRLLAVGNGVVTTTSYDPLTRRLDRLTTTTPDREVQDMVHTYDIVGNVTAVANELPAPSPELFGGPSEQAFTYDPYMRLVGAAGQYRFGSNKTRFYTQELVYDLAGNLTMKRQLDEIQTGGNANNRVTQQPTTYELAPEHTGPGPHQVSRIGTRAYTYDANGNLTGWTDDATGRTRSATWDAEDRMTSVADQGSTTRHTYDARDRLAIERGPSGETAFVNRWYTVRNGTVATKHVFAGSLRVASQRVMPDDVYEHMRYFFHEDLQGSTNLVTDDRGLVFQHLEYFPSGEIWVQEQSDEHRTPFLYTGAYFDEVRALLLLGERWYDPREQVLYSPDPVLYDDPDDVIDDPLLLPAYSYAQASPLGLVDPSGRQTVTPRDRFTAPAAGGGMPPTGSAGVAVGVDPTIDPAGGSSRLSPANPAPSTTREPEDGFAERFGAAPLLEITLTEGEDGWGLESVAISPLLGALQRTVIDRSTAEDADGGDGDAPQVDGAGIDATGDPVPGAGGASAMLSGGAALDGAGGGPAAGMAPIDTGAAPVPDSQAP